MNTEANAGTGETSATTSNARPRKGPRIFARTTMLAVGLLAAAAGIYYLAVTLRGIILDMAEADRGEWASLMGGGLGVWAFFLVRTGIIERAFDLVARLRDVIESLPAPQWSTFLGHTLELSKTLMMPALVTGVCAGLCRRACSGADSSIRRRLPCRDRSMNCALLSTPGSTTSTATLETRALGRRCGPKAIRPSGRSGLIGSVPRRTVPTTTLRGSRSLLKPAL